jgi:hypothetical protein
VEDGGTAAVLYERIVRGVGRLHTPALLRLVTLQSTRLVVRPDVWNIRPGGALAGGTCISYGVGLSASFASAAAAGHALVLDDLAIKVVLGLNNASKEHPAVYAGVGALEAGVMSLYGVVVILGRWVRGLRCRLTIAAHGVTPPE